VFFNKNIHTLDVEAMMLDFGDKKYFMIIQRFLVSILGFWPGSDDIKWWQIAFFILAPCEVLFHSIFQVWFCVANVGDAVEVLRAFTPMITQILTAFKALSIVWNRKQFKEILDYLRDAFVNGKSDRCIECYASSV